MKCQIFVKYVKKYTSEVKFTVTKQVHVMFNTIQLVEPLIMNNSYIMTSAFIHFIEVSNVLKQ